MVGEVRYRRVRRRTTREAEEEQFHPRARVARAREGAKATRQESLVHYVHIGRVNVAGAANSSSTVANSASNSRQSSCPSRRNRTRPRERGHDDHSAGIEVERQPDEKANDGKCEYLANPVSQGPRFTTYRVAPSTSRPIAPNNARSVDVSAIADTTKCPGFEQNSSAADGCLTGKVARRVAIIRVQIGGCRSARHGKLRRQSLR